MSLRRLDIVHVLIRVINKPLHPPIGAYLCLRLASACVVLEVLTFILYLGNCRMGVTRAGILLEVPRLQRLDIQVLQRLQAIII